MPCAHGRSGAPCSPTLPLPPREARRLRCGCRVGNRRAEQLLEPAVPHSSGRLQPRGVAAGQRGLLMALPDSAGEVEQRFSNAGRVLTLPLRAIHAQLVRQAQRGRQPTVSALCCSSSWLGPALFCRGCRRPEAIAPPRFDDALRALELAVRCFGELHLHRGHHAQFTTTATPPPIHTLLLLQPSLDGKIFGCARRLMAPSSRRLAAKRSWSRPCVPPPRLRKTRASPGTAGQAPAAPTGFRLRSCSLPSANTPCCGSCGATGLLCSGSPRHSSTPTRPQRCSKTATTFPAVAGPRPLPLPSRRQRPQPGPCKAATKQAPASRPQPRLAAQAGRARRRCWAEPCRARPAQGGASAPTAGTQRAWPWWRSAAATTRRRRRSLCRRPIFTTSQAHHQPRQARRRRVPVVPIQRRRVRQRLSPSLARRADRPAPLPALPPPALPPGHPETRACLTTHRKSGGRGGPGTRSGRPRRRHFWPLQRRLSQQTTTLRCWLRLSHGTLWQSWRGGPGSEARWSLRPPRRAVVPRALQHEVALPEVSLRTAWMRQLLRGCLDRRASSARMLVVTRFRRTPVFGDRPPT